MVARKAKRAMYILDFRAVILDLKAYGRRQTPSNTTWNSEIAKYRIHLTEERLRGDKIKEDKLTTHKNPELLSVRRSRNGPQFLKEGAFWVASECVTWITTAAEAFSEIR